MTGREPAGTSAPYEPISCAVHDRLEALAVKGKKVVLTYRNPLGETDRVRSRILDIFTSEGAEYLLLENGQRIRLDRILGFGGWEA